ncbi:MAG: DNA polymerase IV [Roseiarcus sp.]|jgi:DNA polymerase IV
MDEPQVRKIIHVDMDAFYASVEQRDDPTLEGRPVAVGFAAKRGVVAAASYEARRFGVRSAMPATTAMRKCAELVFVAPRFDVYRAVSQQIGAIFTAYTPLVEPLSLDEAYLDVTDNLRGIPTAWATAKEIRARILEETGLTASAGVSYNKFLAKLASGHRKPNGQFAIRPDEGEAFVAALPVAKFHGVGPVTAAKMHSLGIETGADLRRQTLAFLQRHFGKSGPWYFEIARGRDDRLVRPDRERKSSGSETTFPEDLTDPVRIEAGVLAMADDVWTWCEKTGFRARTVTVKIKWADFQQSTRSRSMESPIDGRDRLHEVALTLIRSVFPPIKGIRLVGVTLSNFRSLNVSADGELPLAIGLSECKVGLTLREDCDERTDGGLGSSGVAARRSGSNMIE